MKKIIIIFLVLLFTSCSNSNIYNRSNLPMGMYYGTNANFINPTWYHIFVNIRDDTAFVSGFYLFKLNYTLTLQDTLVRVNNSDTLFKNLEFSVLLQNQSLHFVETDGIKSQFHTRTGSVQINFDASNKAKYNKFNEESKKSMFKYNLKTREFE